MSLSLSVPPSQASDQPPPPDGKPLVIGLYGLPGSGKTFMLEKLKKELSKDGFFFYEGSKTIDNLVPGGLKAFQALDEDTKDTWRESAIKMISRRCIVTGKSAIVTGHFMFWSEGEAEGQLVYTRADLDVFTHILYLDEEALTILNRCRDDLSRHRQNVSINHVRNWKKAEKDELRRLCQLNGILFSSISSPELPKLITLVLDFQHHGEGYDINQANATLDKFIAPIHSQGQLERVLVFDADKTLTAQDTGTLFWKFARIYAGKLGHENSTPTECPLKTLFSGPLGYSYTAFRQAALMYEEAWYFEALCKETAAAVSIYPEFQSLLRRASSQQHIAVVVVTCGLRQVWERILQAHGLSRVKVIGGGRISDKFVVTPKVKETLIAHLQECYKTQVWAFGDSILDLPMLSRADKAIVVVGDEGTRSKSMDAALLDAIDNKDLRARQILLPETVTPRLDSTKLPIVDLNDEAFINSIMCRSPKSGLTQVFHTTDRNAAKLLMTPTRDARVAGPALREAHRRIGWYLATEVLADVLGIEERSIPHVQGHYTSGHRVKNEDKTTIIALMRGGEPMALGVSDALPLAQFLHAKEPEHVTAAHLHGQRAVVLVDSVVNSGKSVVEFVNHIRKLGSDVQIVVVSGVVQSSSVKTGDFSQALDRDKQLSVVALRMSDNKFTGKGTTDTGNRLFNTTHMD
ncbi:hypothetical protein G7046_g2879 [Stylonectria norvegica]|nr:hypothetical protein G7046_g2879 [Stylonectria norvegica]